MQDGAVAKRVAQSAMPRLSDCAVVESKAEAVRRSLRAIAAVLDAFPPIEQAPPDGPPQPSA